MGEKDNIKQLLYNFEYAGLVEKDVEKLLACFSEKILGIGMGEQGYVTSIQDVRDVYESGLKDEDTSAHEIELKKIEVLEIETHFGVVCADVLVSTVNPDGKVIKSQFQQSLTVIKEKGQWKICGLHASVPVITEEYLEAYPLKLAEKTLHSLKEKIGVEVYLAEEQYRQAVLADTVAFYIINFTQNRFEKSQLHGDLCLHVNPGTPYQQFLYTTVPEHVIEEDQDIFLKALSLENIEKAFIDGSNEVSCEYRMKAAAGEYVWLNTIIRLIKDVVTGEKKGIMYVKNIDEEKRAAHRIMEKAEYDSMTKVLNKGTMIQNINKCLLLETTPCFSTFLMIDIDHFKIVNDTLGHPAGDKVLTEFAGYLKQVFPCPAFVGRLGGDEFAVFIHGEKIEAPIKGKILDFLELVRRFRLPEDPDYRFSASIGAICIMEKEFEKFYQAADSSLYEAKRTGRDKVVYLKPQ